MKTGWLNVYWRGDRFHAGGLYPTEKEADAIAKPWRVAAVEVKLPPKPITLESNTRGEVSDVLPQDRRASRGQA